MLHAAAGLSRHGADRKRLVLIANGRNPDAWGNRKDSVVFVGYGMFAARRSATASSPGRVLASMLRTFAAAFAALGVKLALAGL